MKGLARILSIVSTVFVTCCATQARDIGSSYKRAGAANLPSSVPTSSVDASDARPQKALGDPCVPEDGWQPVPCKASFIGVDTDGTPISICHGADAFPGPDWYGQL